MQIQCDEFVFLTWVPGQPIKNIREYFDIDFII